MSETSGMQVGDQETLGELLKQHLGILSEEKRSQILGFYDFVLKENQRQNLTRLTSPTDFYYGHVIDVLELLQTKMLAGEPALDLGSGVGVPGLLAGLIGDGTWVLTESEVRKREYLEKAVRFFNLKTRVTVAPGRAEEYLRRNTVKSVVARAVGPVSRIYGWVRSCSTWNTLILFKGPSWSEEWEAFLKTKFRNELIVDGQHSYLVGPEKKERRIVQLKRVQK